MPLDLVLPLLRKAAPCYRVKGSVTLSIASPEAPVHVIVDGIAFLLALVHLDVSCEDGELCLQHSVCSLIIIQKFVLGVPVCPNRDEAKQVWMALDLKRPHTQLMCDEARKGLLMWDGKV